MRLTVTGTLDSGLFDGLLLQSQPCIEGADRQLVLDLSGVEFASPSGLVPLASLVRALTRRGVDFRVEAYPDESVCWYYCRMDPARSS